MRALLIVLFYSTGLMRGMLGSDARRPEYAAARQGARQLGRRQYRQLSEILGFLFPNTHADFQLSMSSLPPATAYAHLCQLNGLYYVRGRPWRA